MESIIKPSWLAMSESRLYAHLKKREYPPHLIDTTIEQVRKFKEERRKQRIKATMGHNLWLDVLRPARTELGVVRTMKSQTKRVLAEDFGHPETQAKMDALNAYDPVIAKTVERLAKAQKSGEITPSQLAQALVKQGKLPTGITGNHWTEFVTPEDRKRVEALFKRVPDPQRGKRKEPFERRISPQENARLRSALWDKIDKEKAQVNQELDMATSPEKIKELEGRLARLQEAGFKLNSLARTAPVPNTWHGLFKD